MRPDHEALYHKAFALSQLEKYTDSLTTAERIVQLKPDWSKGWDIKAGSLTMLGRFDEALSAYERALAFGRDDPSIWTHKGIALIRANSVKPSLSQLKEAIACFNKALEISPKHESARRLIRTCREELEKSG